MGSAYWSSWIVYAAATLRIPDILAAGPMQAEKVASQTQTALGPLRRLLRTLAGLGVLETDAAGRFGLTPMGAALRFDAPRLAYAAVLTFGSAWFGGGIDRLLEAVRTGRSETEVAVSMTWFEYLAEHPDEAALFSQTMVGFHHTEPQAVADSYDFSSCRRIVDIGGATGNMLAAILAAYPTPYGICSICRTSLTPLPPILRRAADR